MRCETCHGTGTVVAPATLDEEQRGLNDIWAGDPYPFPCPDCGGCGVAHCCEGLREQPEEGDWQ
jgi:hypothetical protein